MKLYSPSKNAFYEPTWKYPDLPKDLIEVKDEEHAELFRAQAAGRVIVSEKGKPKAVPPPPMSSENMMIAIKKTRDSLLTKSDWTQLADVDLTSQEKNAWAVYRRKLRDLPDTLTDLNNVQWPVPPN